MSIWHVVAVALVLGVPVVMAALAAWGIASWTKRRRQRVRQ